MALGVYLSDFNNSEILKTIFDWGWVGSLILIVAAWTLSYFLKYSFTFLYKKLIGFEPTDKTLRIAQFIYSFSIYTILISDSYSGTHEYDKLIFPIIMLELIHLSEELKERESSKSEAETM